MRIPLYQVDAFTLGDKPFTGNPASVCPLETWLPEPVMQAIAAENNQAETAFFVPESSGYAIRWFTPLHEMDLCGHATLASAFIVLNRLAPALPGVVFQTRRAGTLTVGRDGPILLLDFPSWPAAACLGPPSLALGLGRAPAQVLAARDYLCVYDSEADVAALTPDFAVLAGLDRAVIVTAPASGNGDFVSRFFAPVHGVNEDSVTGSSHCSLIPYWAGRLGKNTLAARQISQRGGSLFCTLAGDRVSIGGRAVLYLEGAIEI
jgi:predicted PhzF superfamily epimerase YddE/YHI9